MAPLTLATRLVAAGVFTLCLGAADDPCRACVERYSGKIAPDGRARHQALVQAGRRYEIVLSPVDANADLIVSADGDWPPAPIGCRSALGSTEIDRCTFEAKATGPLYLFVIGKELATRYEVGVAPASP